MAKGKRLKPTPPQAAASTITPGPWPPFKPQLPVTDLVPETLVPDKVIVYRSFFPRSLCRDYVSYLRDLPLTLTPGKPKRGDALRVNDRYQVDDPAFAERLWNKTGLKDAVLQPDLTHLWGGEVVGLNSNIRVYRYQKGHFFDAHYDDSNVVTVKRTGQENDELVPAKTTWTLLLYLTSSSEGCNGGETVFYTHDRRSPKEEIAVSPETGMLLLHKHGNDCLLHEGREVTAGEKWILRTDLCIRNESRT
ncbi:putative prolyl 4-hydroxylase 4 [Echria macrotheca]|uniref:Prolyl 4-hydroxylase 4 n=1 Tax=Echria macrotheca TaxID=438768 RepID=A0AAJ0F8Z2_9PEZI|nr:putative prolyl 4-hydroxylase 4 [Echria macrotheca]